MSAVIWLHEDALSAQHPVFNAAPANTPCLHVWDESYLQTQHYSLKRLVFLYETLIDLPVEIIAADTLSFWQNHPAQELWVPETPNPWIRRLLNTLETSKQITVVSPPPFVSLSTPLHATRFHRYWKLVEDQLMDDHQQN